MPEIILQPGSSICIGEVVIRAATGDVAGPSSETYDPATGRVVIVNQTRGRIDSIEQRAAPSGESDLLKTIAKLAERWARSADSSLKIRHRLRMSDAALGKPGMPPEKRAMLAAACDLFDLLASGPQGRQALTNLGFEPLAKNREAE